jgi:hypothetical protein
MGSGPLTDGELDRLRQMHSTGASRNQIAAALGRSGSTITSHAQRLGLTFERGTEVAAATAAKVMDAKARRAQLQLDLLAKAERLLSQIDQPTLAFNFGGKENTYEQKTIPEPTFADKRNIIQAVSVAVGTSIKIDEHDQLRENMNAVDAWIAEHIGSGA